jgi:KRAB domain-containing zinc finger protein
VDLFCDHCGYKTVIKDTLKGHVKTHIPKEFRYGFSCTLCDAAFISKQQFKTHTAQHLKKTEGFSVDSIFSCDLCSRHFASKSQLSSHKSRSHKDNRTECKFCDRSMFDKNVLKKHMKKFHKDEIDESILTCIERGEKATGWIKNAKPEIKVPKKKQISSKPVEKRICDYCGKMVNRTAFHSHMRRQHHDGSKKFQCDLCPTFYFLKEQLVQHMVKHVPRTVRQKHQCHLCESTFVSRLGKANHIKIVHETTEKNFKCQFCEVN